MTYEQLKHLKDSAFKRRCGIHQETFARIVEVLRPHLNRQGERGGQCKLSALRPTAASAGKRRGNIGLSFILLRVGA